MLLTVNGEPHRHRGDGTAAALLAELGAAPEHTALAVNGDVVPAGERAARRLQAGDTVEVLTFVGGG